MTWRKGSASLRPSRGGLLDAGHARAFARIECHFFQHRGWLERDDQILRNMDRIARIPGVVVQGRYDIICPPVSAIRVADAWPAGSLRLIDDAGHALSEPGIARELLRATDQYAEVR